MFDPWNAMLAEDHRALLEHEALLALRQLDAEALARVIATVTGEAPELLGQRPAGGGGVVKEMVSKEEAPF
jgi:hypothetical protein